MIVKRIPVEQKAWKVSDLSTLEPLPDELLAAMERRDLNLGTDPLQINTNFGWVTASDDDYLILASNGVEIYPCDKDDFELGYEILDTEDSTP